MCDHSGLHELIEMIDFVIQLENRVPANICTVQFWKMPMCLIFLEEPN